MKLSFLTLVFLGLSFLLGSSVQAQEVAKPVSFLLAYGSEFRPEKDAQGNFADHLLSNYAIGFGYESFVFLLERAQFQESSGNATLSTDRTLQDYLLWTQYRPISWYHFVPFMEAGAGFYKEKIDTQFMGASASNESGAKLLGGIGFGIGLEIPILWLSLETRLLVGDELDQKPTIGGVARLGIWF
jgi:hypothetical protein